MFSNPNMAPYLMGQQRPYQSNRIGLGMPTMPQIPGILSPASQGMMPAVPAAYSRQESEKNPLGSGTRAAMEATRRNIEPDEVQRQRAMGIALMSMAANMAHNPNENKLWGISKAFGPAMDAYIGQMQEYQKANTEALKDLRTQEKEERHYALELAKLNQKEEMTPYQSKMIALKEKEIEKKAAKKSNEIPEPPSGFSLPEDALPFNQIGDKNLAKEYYKDLQERKSRIRPMEKNLKNLEQMKDIIDKNPHLYGSLASLIDYQDKKDPGLLKNIIKKFNKKDQINVEKLEKLISDIFVNEIKSLKGQRPTDLLKNAVKGALPRVGGTTEAFNLIYDNLTSEYKDYLNDAKQAHRGWKNRYYVPETYGTAQEVPAIADEEITSTGIKPSPGALKQQKIMRHREKHPELSNYSDDVVAEAMRLEGLL